MNKLFAGVLLAVAVVGCRSVPVDVRTAHENAVIEQKAAFTSLETMMEKGVDNTQALVDALRFQYEIAMKSTIEQRVKVEAWLTEEDLSDALRGHTTLIKTLYAIHANYSMLYANWQSLNQPGASEYMDAMKRHINMANDLLRRFDDYIKQFKVNGGQ